MPALGLRILEAIRLAGAVTLEESLIHGVCCDDRLNGAAAEVGLSTAAPS